MDLDELPVTVHARRMIRACWDLGALPELAGLRLRPWAHMLGFRGHFATKSRRYSITLGEIRQDRTDHRAAESRERLGLPVSDSTLTPGHWRFAGQGYSDAERVVAESIGERVRTARHIAEREGRDERGCA